MFILARIEKLVVSPIVSKIKIGATGYMVTITYILFPQDSYCQRNLFPNDVPTLFSNCSLITLASTNLSIQVIMAPRNSTSSSNTGLLKTFIHFAV
jgi:hypothetical protein